MEKRRGGRGEEKRRGGERRGGEEERERRRGEDCCTILIRVDRHTAIEKAAEDGAPPDRSDRLADAASGNDQARIDLRQFRQIFSTFRFLLLLVLISLRIRTVLLSKNPTILSILSIRVSN